MVLRKPYAFLIRHFKAIHLILVVLMAILAYKMYQISAFLGPYIESGEYRAISGVASKYVGLLGFVLPLLILFLLGSITFLLKRKEKPIKFYLISMLIYLLELITIVVAYSILTSIQQGNVNTTFASIFSDLIRALAIIPLPIIIVSLVRGVGFNVKQFNFKKDLIDLSIEEGDSEEFELDVEFDNENLKAKFNRRLRFIKYVYLENKKVFFGILILIIFVIIGLVVKYITSIEHIYKEGEHYSSSGIDFVINKTYITNLDCRGKEVKADKYYVIVNMTGTNNYDEAQKLPMNYIYLKVSGHKQYNPIDIYLDEFSDLGPRMTSDTEIDAKKTMNFNIVFEIDSSDKDNEMRFDHIKSFSQNLDGSYKYAKVVITPKKFKEEKVVNTVNLGEKLEFKDSLVEGTSITISSAEIANKFEYKYKKTIGGKEKEFTKPIYPTDSSKFKKSVLKMDANLVQNPSLNKRIYKSFYEKFALIEYEVDGKMYYGKSFIIDLTQSDGYTYLEINKEASTSKKVNLVFTIRDKVYKYTIIDIQEEEKTEDKKDVVSKN